MIIKSIPRENHNNRFIYDEDDNKNIKENRQKWPIFGEKLINGNINNQIYKYICSNHRENNICLLALLFPEDVDNDDKTNENINKKIILSKEIKNKILNNLINNCLGEKNNYSLFKYIYLMPARSLLYNNLYEEIIKDLTEDKSFNYENIREKEIKFINNIQKEIKISLKIKENNQYFEEKNEDEDEDEEEDDDEDENDFFNIDDINDRENNEEKNIFKCLDQKIKKFIGFNSDIIPGEIVREEIELIAYTQNNLFKMFRAVYYTTYFKFDELRNYLLNNKYNKKNENMHYQSEKEKNNIKNDIIKTETNENEILD